MTLNCRAVFFDLSGVLYDGDRLIPNAVETVYAVRDQGMTLRFVTNTATRSAGCILSKLERFGIPLVAEELFTAPLAAKAYAEAKSLRPYLIVHPEIRPLFDDLEQDDPNCVLLGDAREGLNYEAMNQAFQYCHNGAELLAIGCNKYFSQDGRLQLDSGAYVKALEWASGQTACILGKPGKAFFEQVVASCLLYTSDAADE